MPGPYRTVGWTATPFLAASPSDSADEPVFERTVITAMSRLLPIQSRARHTLATYDFAFYAEVDHRAAQHIALVAETCSGLTIG